MEILEQLPPFFIVILLCVFFIVPSASMHILIRLLTVLAKDAPDTWIELGKPSLKSNFSWSVNIAILKWVYHEGFCHIESNGLKKLAAFYRRMIFVNVGCLVVLAFYIIFQSIDFTCS